MYRKLSVHLTQCSGEFFSLCLFKLGNASHRLRTQDVASPVATDLIISVIIIGPNSSHQLSQNTLVFRVTLCEGNSGACLPVDQASQSGLSLDDAVGHPHLSTQDRQENHQLSGVYVMGNHHQLNLLVLHQGGDCIDSC
uniref:Uncharacterized protein n=1 Tax=Mus spicilegus TaxID=10103 RepID=A0A8C6H5B6_MUSSI